MNARELDISVLLKGFVKTNYVTDNGADVGLPMYIADNSSVAAGLMTETVPGAGYVRLIGYILWNNATADEAIILRFDPDNTWFELN